MRMASKDILKALAFGGLLVGGPAFASTGGSECGTGAPGFLSFSFAKPCEAVSKAGEMACTSTGYKPNNSACMRCKGVVEKWKQQFPELAKQFGQQDQSIFSLFGGQTMAASKSMGSSELAAFQKSSQANQTAKKGQTKRATNAADAKKKFQQCLDEIAKQCPNKLAPVPDKQVAEAVQKACEDAKNGAGKFADEKKKDSNGMGDLSKLMDAASKAMQAAQGLAQQQQQQDPSSITPSDPAVTSPTAAAAPQTEANNLDGKSSVAAPTVGFGAATPGNQVATDNAGVGSVTGMGASSPVRDLASASNDLGTAASGAAPFAATAGGGGSGGATSGFNSSGSSRPEDGTGAGAAADPSAASNYEISPGGGGRAIVGLKPSKGDLDSLADGAAPALDTAKLDDLGGTADPGAETASAPEDVLAHDSDSIFLRIRQKYSLLKGAGRL
jgi:hypothetical protein